MLLYYQSAKNILIYCILLLSILLISCTKAKDDRITLRVGVWGTPDSMKLQEKHAKEFTRLHPDIIIEIEPVPGDMVVAFLTRIAGGGAPDIFYTGNWFLFDFADKGALLSLDEYIKRDNIDMSQFFDSVLTGVRWEGKTFGIPEGFNVEAIYYNKDIFDRFNVPYPKPGWTWNEYLNTARSLTKDVDRDGKTDVWGCYVWTWIPGFLPFVLQNEANMFNEDYTRFTMDTPNAIEALHFIKDLIYKYKVAPTPRSLQAQSGIEMFQSGRLAMGAFGFWAVQQLKEAKFRWDVAELPRKKKTGNVVHVHSYTINAETKYPEEAWEFIKFLTLGKAAEDIDHIIPAQKSIAYKRVHPRQPNMPENSSIILKMASDPNTVSPPFGPKFGEYSSVLILEFDGIWLNKVSIEQSVAKAKPQVEYILNN